MGRPKLGKTETERMQLKITSAEIEAIDDWRFTNRVPSRSEAVRRLCQIGVLTSKATPAMESHSTMAMSQMVLLLSELARVCNEHPQDAGLSKVRSAVERHGKIALLRSAQAMTEVGELSNHVSQLVKPREIADALAVVAQNIIRKGEVDAQTVDFVKDALEGFE